MIETTNRLVGCFLFVAFVAFSIPADSAESPSAPLYFESLIEDAATLDEANTIVRAAPEDQGFEIVVLINYAAGGAGD